MKRTTAAWTAAMAILASAASLAAHHSLARFDTETPVWVKGSVVRFEALNPHSRIYLDEKMDDGQVQRWVVDSPGITVLTRMGVARDVLEPGDVIDVCGFTLRERVPSPQPSPETGSSGVRASTPNAPDRFINGHLLVMPDGAKRFWSDYGQLEKCLAPGETRNSLIG